MDVTSINKEVVPEKIEDKKDGGARQFLCDLNDTELVHKIAQVFLPGLATACVDNTTGDIFRTPGSVAVDIRTEMVEYLTQRSQSFVAESVILEDDPEAEASDHPYDIISDFIDDFATTKRNLFSRVSGWLLSEKREDKIDDFVQEMEISGFWLMDRREAIARTLLRNVDFKNEFHCNMTFNSNEELNNHYLQCGFRSMNCENEGCNTRFSARQMEKHDLVCPFKIIPCEQKCSAILMRREMDRHCITGCPMKLTYCPFYAVGCQSTVPQCKIEQHRVDDLRSHLLYILQGMHKEASVEDLKKRIERLDELSSGNLGEARDVRSLTLAVKNLEIELGPLEVTVIDKDTKEGQVDKEGKEVAAGPETLNPTTEIKVSEERTTVEEGQAGEADSVSSKSTTQGEVNKTSAEGKDNEASTETSNPTKSTTQGSVNKSSEEGIGNEVGTETSNPTKSTTQGAVNKSSEEGKGNKVSTESSKPTTQGAVDKAREEGKLNEENVKEDGSKKLKSEAQVSMTHKEDKVIEAGKKAVANAAINKVSEEGKDNEQGNATEAGSTTLKTTIQGTVTNKEGKSTLNSSNTVAVEKSNEGKVVIEAGEKPMTYEAAINKVSEGQIGEAGKNASSNLTTPKGKISEVGGNTMNSTTDATLNKSSEGELSEMDTKISLSTTHAAVDEVNEDGKVGEDKTETLDTTHATKGAETKV